MSDDPEFAMRGLTPDTRLGDFADYGGFSPVLRSPGPNPALPLFLSGSPSSAAAGATTLASDVVNEIEMPREATPMAPPPPRQRKPRKPKAPTLKPKDWEVARNRITDLHKTHKRSEINATIKREFGIEATYAPHHTTALEIHRQSHIRTNSGCPF